MTDLTGKTAVVTGGRQGIGRAIVDTYLERGAKVLTCGRGQRPDKLNADIYWQQTDVSNNHEIKLLKDKAESIFGKVDILVNNAGLQIEKTILDTTDEEWDSLMGVNAKGVFLSCRAFIPVMSQGGSIINIGSISGRLSDPGLALYNASKAFVHGLTRSIAVDHGPGVRCNAICPGWIMTDMADAAFDQSKDPESAKRDALARHAVGRFGKPQDIANMATWLASDESAFASGQMFTVDGAMTAASPINTGLF